MIKRQKTKESWQIIGISILFAIIIGAVVYGWSQNNTEAYNAHSCATTGYEADCKTKLEVK